MLHLVPYFAERPLARIEPADIDAFIASCRGRCAPKSIRNYLGTLHSVFEFAKVRPNPVAEARPETESADPDIRFLNEEELEALLRAVPDDQLGPTDRALYLTAAMTGLRQGELIALRWRDVDWPARRVRVRRSYTRGRGGAVRKAEVAALKPGGADARPRRRGARAPLPALAPSRATTTSSSPTRRPAARSTPRRCASGSRRRSSGRGPAGPLPRPAPHLRDPDGGGRRAAADAAGVDGPPRLQDDDDLRRLRAERPRARARRPSVLRGPFGGPI